MQVLFKMDKAGEGQEIVAADLPNNRDPSFVGFTHQMFLEVNLLRHVSMMEVNRWLLGTCLLQSTWVAATHAW